MDNLSKRKRNEKQNNIPLKIHKRKPFLQKKKIRFLGHWKGLEKSTYVERNQWMTANIRKIYFIGS